MRAGTGTPLFLVHSVTGSVMECWTLIGAMQSPRPVYGLQARGLDGEQPAQQRVEDMAASYIVQMRTVQPTGPYAVAGYSFGGLIALEIAQQLRRAGEPIELLCLIDTYADAHCLPWRARLRHRVWLYGLALAQAARSACVATPRLREGQTRGRGRSLADARRVHGAPPGQP